MGEIVELQDQRLIEDQDFVSDLTRFSEQLLTEKFIRRKYGNLDDATWTRLGESDELLAKIEAESIRRRRDGSAKKEKAQLHVLAAPDVAAKIMKDDGANNRHRLDACKVLDDFAANGPASAPASERFIITLNLGADTLKFDKSFSIGVEPNDVAAITTIEKKEDDGGE